jgi:hypothetical protein
MPEESEEESEDSYNKEFEKWPSRGDRAPFKIESAKECSLKEITGKEKKVAVIGTLKSVDRKDMQGILSDGTEECIVVFTEGDMLPGLKEGMVLRVIGAPSKKPKLSIEAEIVQELKGFDSNLYKKVKELEKKHFGGEK